MNERIKILNAVKLVGVTLLAVGLILFSFGLFQSGSTLVPIGIGTVIGAVFIFLMGLFFVATDEMTQKTRGS